ncbi:WD domain, G-beta repeat [Novymonas esmeraldas]|uniref:WD domain, G-beta repeat n=1 Tax=Novymonas esmeraldas TaxID=1808958 RepID=A0AAW0ET88_9TRYP
MPLSSSFHDSPAAAAPLHGGRYSASERPTPVRSAVAYVGRGTARSRRSAPPASAPAAASPSSRAQAPLEACGASSGVREHVTDADGTVVPVAVLTSEALARTSLLSADPVTPSRSPHQSRRRGGSMDGGSAAAASTRVSRRRTSMTPQPLSPSPAWRTPGGAVPGLTLDRRPSLQSSQGRAASTSPTHAKGSRMSPSLAPAASPGSSRLPHPRPLLSSKEADYLHLAYQRGFMGRFRCATPVVVRTPPSATSHADTATLANAAAAAAAAATGEASESLVPNADAPQSDDESHVPVPVAVAVAVAAGGAPSRSGRRVSASGASVASSATAGRGGVSRGRAVSVVNGRRQRRLLPSSAASAAVTSASVRHSDGRPVAAVGSVPSANMAALARSGLHTSLWLAVQDGGLEVRSMANPNQVLASLPRRDPRAIITAIAEVCGNRVVAGYTDGSLQVYDAVSMTVVAGHRAHTAAVSCMLYTRSTPRLALAGSSAAPGAAGSDVPPAQRSSAPTQSLLLTASLDRTIVVWEAASMTHLHRLKCGPHSVCALAATVTGGYVFSGSDDGTLRMWDAVQGEQLTITNEERVSIAKADSPTSLPPRLSQPLLSAPASLTGMLSRPSLTAPSSAAREAAALMSEGAGPVTTTTTTTAHPQGSAARGSPHMSLRASVSVNSSSHGPPPLPPPPPPPHTASHLQRRAFEGYGAAGLGILGTATRTGARAMPLITRGTRHLARTAAEGSDASRASSLASLMQRLPPPPLLTSFVSPFAAEEEEDDVAAFIPTESGTMSALLGEGSTLVRPGGDISPLHGDGGDVERGGATASGTAEEEEAVAVAVAGGHDRHSAGRRSAATVRTLRDLRRDIKRRAKGLSAQGGGGGSGGEVTGAAKLAPRDAKATKPKGETPKAGRRSVARAVSETTATAPTPTPTPVRARGSVNALEQRLELWLHAYRQRVRLSAAAVRLTQRISAGYDAVAAVNWPIERAHSEYVAALAVVEDRLLVSASRDASAKVFALPSGQFVRTLTSSRHMPLSSILYDASVQRLYTAFSDGGLAAYDTRHAELPLLSQMQSPHTILSSTFVRLRLAPMHRFVWAAAAPADGAVPSTSTVVTSVAQFDRTTMAHGPNQTTTSYRVGQPSLRELNAAVSLQTLQRQRACSIAELAQRVTSGALEGSELVDRRRCGLVLERGYARRQTSCAFVRWRQWARRRALLRQYHGVAAVHAEGRAIALLGRYAVRWQCWARTRTTASSAEVLREVQLRASDAVALDVRGEVCARRWRVGSLLASSMARQRQRAALAAAYRCWRVFVADQQAHLRQSMAFNTLLLSMNAGAYTPQSCAMAHLTRAATRRTGRAKALWLVTEKTQRRCAPVLRRRCFDLWRTWAERGGGGAPVRALALTAPPTLRRRYFALWHDFAVHVTRRGRLENERDTLRLEWATLQRTLEAPQTAAELRDAAGRSESAAVAAAAEATRLRARLAAVAQETEALRTQTALAMLVSGFRIPSVVQAAAGVGTSAAGDASSTASLRGGSHASATSTPRSNGGGCGRSASATAEAGEEAQEGEDDARLLVEVSAVLRALKGSVVQCAADDKLLASAHALALRLPICEPAAWRDSVSVDASPRRPLQQLRTPRRQSAWSVTHARSGGGGGGGGTAAALGGAGPTSSASSPVHSASGGAARAPSAAQMWAAHPAEEVYASLADAFDAVHARLGDLLRDAALGCGATAVDACAGAGVPTAWLAELPPKQRRVVVGEVLKLVALFDSFAAHNDLPVECAGSLSMRGSANTRALPLSSLCSRHTAATLLQRAAVLLELVDPQLWPRQVQLARVQDACAVAMAELDATVSSSAACFSDAPPHNSTVMTVNSAGSGDGEASPAATPLVMRPPAVSLSAAVLQEAGAAMLQRQGLATATAHTATATATVRGARTRGPLATDHPTQRSTSSGPTAPAPTSPLSHAWSKFDLPTARVQSTSDPLTSTLRCSEEGAEVAEVAENGEAPTHVRSHSLSYRSYSSVSTPRSYTPRASTVSVQGAGPGGSVVKPYLGFRVSVNRDAQALRRTTTTISIREVTPHYTNADGAVVDAPAQVAGLQVGDQLVRFAGYAVTDLAAFNAVVARHVHTGAQLPVVVLRNGEQLHKSIVVGSRTNPGL